MLLSRASFIVFSVPAVKGIEFGDGFMFSQKYGSEANDSFYYDENKNVRTKTNHNGGINGGTGGGIVAYVYTKPQEKSIAWQKALYEALIKKTGLKGNRATPLAKQNLHEVREPAMPSVLLELGFMDSKTDVPVLLTEDYADKCAEAIVEVIVSRQKLQKKEELFNGCLLKLSQDQIIQKKQMFILLELFFGNFGQLSLLIIKYQQKK